MTGHYKKNKIMKIWDMEMMKNNLSDTMFENLIGYIQSIPTKLELYFHHYYIFIP